MGALYRFLKSTRLAVVLILVIVTLSLVSTFVPQGRPAAWYAARYPHPVSTLIVSLGLDAFFRSAIFLVPVGLFTLNLGACTVGRMVSRALKRSPRRYGPDLVHVGLLVLIAAGLVTGLSRQETVLELASGEAAALENGATLRVVSLSQLTYDDGRPRDWISTVDVMEGGKDAISAFPIAVNHPLRLRGYSVYQSSWNTRGIIGVTGSDGAAGTATTGEGFTEGDSFWYFAEVRQEEGTWRAVFEQYRQKNLVGSRILSVGDTIGPFRIRSVATAEVTGLKVVRDPGLAPFLAAAVLILVGLGITLAQKRMEERA